MNKDEALRLALEALESTGENNGYHGVTQYFDETMVDQAITAIKATLEAKDEPVAWYLQGLNQRGVSLKKETQEWKPLYTTPPQRKPLTDEEIAAISKATHFQSKPVTEFARAIEAAHGIKGEA